MKMLPIEEITRPYFVYGTLRPGMGLHGEWERRGAHARLDGVAHVRGFVMTWRGVPFAHRTGCLDDVIVGALIVPNRGDLNEAYWLQERLDRIEASYVREPVEVHGDTSPVEAWMYVAPWAAHPEAVIPSPADYVALRTPSIP